MRLEQYHLGEVERAERADVERHLLECPVCRACLTRIETDEELALPPLELKGVAPRRSPIPTKRWPRLAVGVSALAAAAVVTMAVGQWRHREGEIALRTGGSVKGGSVTISLVRDDGERFVGQDGVFRDGDRFKAVVSCPPGSRPIFDLVVLDEDGATFPNPPADAVTCGNDVPLPGAFRLTARSKATVCIAWTEGAPPDRAELAEEAEERDSDRVHCIDLRRAPR